MRCQSSFLRCRLHGFLRVLMTIAVNLRVSIHLFLARFCFSYLVEVDCRFPELVVGLVEISHADLSKVTGMVLVDVRSVMVLATSHTATTWMLSVLAYTTVAGGDVAATVRERMSALCSCTRCARPVVSCKSRLDGVGLACRGALTAFSSWSIW